MTSYKDQLLTALSNDGWEQLEVLDLNQWWADDCWRMRSVKMAWGMPLYLTFLVDPMWASTHTQAFADVWAVVATIKPPVNRSPDALAWLTMRKRKFQPKLDDFMADLRACREAVACAMASRRRG